MELLLRVEVATVDDTSNGNATAAGHKARDIRLTATDDQPMDEVVGQILAELELPSDHTWRATNRRTGDDLLQSGTLADTQLVSGDVVSVAKSTARFDRPTTSPWRLIVTAGAQVGRTYDLKLGTSFTVGRSQADGFRLPEDTELGRSQLTFTVDSAFVVKVAEREEVVTAATLNGRTLTPAPSEMHGGDEVRVGNLVLKLEAKHAAPQLRVDKLGLVPFAPGPRRRPIVQSETIPPPQSLPVKPEPPRFQAMTVLLPLVAGIGLAAVIGDPRFLLFALLGPVGAIANQLDHSRRLRGKYRNEKQEFRRELSAHRDRLASAQSEEQRTRAELSPDVGRVGDRATDRKRSLWNRRFDHDDRLNLRLGTGAVRGAFDAAPYEGAGDPEFRDQVQEQIAEFDTVSPAPVTVRIDNVGCLAIVGQPFPQALSIARSVLIQAVCFNSPETLVVTAIVDRDSDVYRSTQFLPHCRSSMSPISGAHAVAEPNDAAALLRKLESTVRARQVRSREDPPPRPNVLLLIDCHVPIDAALLAPILEDGPAAGVYTLFVADDPGLAPRHAGAVVRCQAGTTRARIWYTEEGAREDEFVREGATAELLDTVSRALAPLRDDSTQSTTSAIPRFVRLFDAVGISSLDTTPIEANWNRPRRNAVISNFGSRRDGTMSVDLVAHGPHALIGGTSGAGKSELVQALVAGLVVENPPEHVQMMFIDFKGGSASAVFKDLPHVVGRVTDLDEYLADRALESIRAELRSRVEQFAKLEAADLKDMIKRFPDAAPASLVIIIDEFATLINELPSFVNAIVDIAQRGRSYGIHLILATQRPSTSVNENILANTNLRISLRMLDSAESANLIGVPDAHQIPVPLRGRALARLGPTELVEFQSGFGGARFTRDDVRAPASVAPIDVPPLAADSSDDDSTDTEIRRLCALINSIGREPAAPVWQEPVSGNVCLDNVIDELTDESRRSRPQIERLPLAEFDADPERYLPVGVYDDATLRQQYPAVVDLKGGGGFGIIGSAGSGATNALRVVAQAASRGPMLDGSSPTPYFALDCGAGGLASVQQSVACVEYASISDIESVTRILGKLDEVVARRLADPDRPRTRALLLVDGFPAFDQAFKSTVRSDPGADQTIALMRRVVERGRTVGVHLCFSADRTSSVPTWLTNAVSERVLLRTTDDDESRIHGEASTRRFAPGAGLIKRLRVQIADASLTASDHAAQPVDEELTAELTSTPLPFVAACTGVQFPVGEVEIGLTDIGLDPASVDLKRETLTISGPSESGKSITLRVLADHLRAVGLEVYGIGPAGCGLADSHELTIGGFTREHRAQVAAAAGAALSEASKDNPVFLLVDDVDRMEDSELEQFTSLLTGSRSVRLVGSTTRANATHLWAPLAKELQNSRQHLVLQPPTPQAVADAANLGLAPILRPGLTMPPGRGVLVAKSRMTVVQVTLSQREIALLRETEDA